MNVESSNSAEIIQCLDRLRAGDMSARQELIRTAQNRLVRLARKMLSDFPGVRRWEDTDDVFQDAVIRLCSTLERVVPDSVCAFIHLAAREMRCALIDLARHYYGPQGLGTHYHSGSKKNSLLHSGWLAILQCCCWMNLLMVLISPLKNFFES